MADDSASKRPPPVADEGDAAMASKRVQEAAAPARDRRYFLDHDFDGCEPYGLSEQDLMDIAERAAARRIATSALPK